MRRTREVLAIFLVVSLSPAAAWALSGATYVSQSVPGQMQAGKAYLVSVTMRNAGTTIWTRDAGFRLGSQNPQDNQNWGLGRVDLGTAESVAPNAIKAFSFSVTAPKTAGFYHFQWRMLQESVEWFGDLTPDVVVAVAPSPPTGLSPSGAQLPSSTTSASLAWSSVSGATTYPVRAKDLTDPTAQVFNNCGNPPNPPIYYCKDDVTGLNQLLPVQSNHCYEWWVHAVGPTGWSDLANAFFCVVPRAPSNLSPDGVQFPSTTTSVSLGWAPVSGITNYPVRVKDLTDPTSQVFNNCNDPPQPPIYFCKDDVGGLSQVVPVKAGHSYEWWVHAVSAAGWSVLAAAHFGVDPIPSGISASYSVDPPISWTAGYAQPYSVAVTNTGPTTWPATGVQRVRLAVSFGGSDDTPGVGWVSDQRFDLPHDVAPGASVTLSLRVAAPAATGSFILRHRMTDGVSWAGQLNKAAVFVGTPTSYVTPSAPSWTPGAILYDLRVDRFSPDGKFTGLSRPVAGIGSTPLEYLRDLGVTAVILSPLARFAHNPAFSDGSADVAYGTIDPEVLDSRFGASDDFRAFIADAHSKGIKVIVDVVLSGLDYYQSSVPHDRPELFIWGESAVCPPPLVQAPIPCKTTCFGDMCTYDYFSSDLTKQAAVRDYVANAILRGWVTKFDIDGFRCDLEPDYAGRAGVWQRIASVASQFGRSLLLIQEGSQFGSGLGPGFSFSERDYSANNGDPTARDFFCFPPPPNASSRDCVVDITDEIRSDAGQFYCSAIANNSGDYVAKGNLVYFGYGMLLAPFIPNWYMGEEFNYPLVTQPPYSLDPFYHVLYFATVDWSKTVANQGFLSQVRKVIQIRKQYQSLFWPLSGPVRDTAPHKVPASPVGSLPVYAFVRDGVAIVIAGAKPGSAWSGRLAVPLAELGLAGFGSFEIADLMEDQSRIASAAEVASLATTVASGGLRVLKISGVAMASVDDALFVSQTSPPAFLCPGSVTTVSVTMKNTGGTVWDSTYRLGSQNPQDNANWGLGRVFLGTGETVSPGQSKTFTFNVTMASTPGTYNFQWRMIHEGVQWLGAFTPNVVVTNVMATAATPAATPGDRLWVDDQLPGGAVPAGIWNWDATQKASGSQSNVEPAAAGFHQHYFYGATQALTVQTGEKLIAYVLIDPCNPPQEVMLQWSDGSWEHRAFWGQDLIAWGQAGTASRLSMGALPDPGQWARLEVPVQSLGLAGRTLDGMAFTLFGGRAWFDRAGAAAAAASWASSGFYTLVPCRAVDTRGPVGIYGGPPLQPSAARVFALAGVCGIPSNAKAVAVNLTIADTTAAGNLITYPAGSMIPGTSVLNFSAQQTRANNAVISVSQDGTSGIAIYNASTGSNQLIIDIVGYFR